MNVLIFQTKNKKLSKTDSGMQPGNIAADLSPFQNLLVVAESLLKHHFHFGKLPPGLVHLNLEGNNKLCRVSAIREIWRIIEGFCDGNTIRLAYMTYTKKKFKVHVCDQMPNKTRKAKLDKQVVKPFTKKTLLGVSVSHPYLWWRFAHLFRDLQVL